MFEEILEKLPFIGGKGKKKSKASNSFDLLYQLSYMSVIAAGGVPRAKIFARSAELPCASAVYFHRIELACRRLKYDYAQACRIIGESCEDEDIRGLLLRLSSSLLSGEPEAEFLTREAEAVAESYENEYGRKLETMKMWTDAYVSLILSAVLVIIIGIVSTMIWKIETPVIMGMAFLSVFTTAVGVWLIYVVSPREAVVLDWPGSREQKLASQLFKYFIPAGVVIAALLLATGIGLGWALLAIGIFVFPIGLLMAKDDSKVTKCDAEIGVFLRSLGGVSAALGTTVTAALGRLDMDAINTLRRAVKDLYTRLHTGIRTYLCWQKFIEETGSELTNRSVGMFYDTIDLGGAAGEAGYQASIYAGRVALLRARRKTVSGPFQWLSIAMHASVVALLVFITEVIMAFASMVTLAEETLPNAVGGPSLSAFTSFNVSGLEIMHALTLPLVLIFTIANAIAPSIADGGSWYKIFYNLGITATISGMSLLLLPGMASTLFQSVQM